MLKKFVIIFTQKFSIIFLNKDCGLIDASNQNKNRTEIFVFMGRLVNKALSYVINKININQNEYEIDVIFTDFTKTFDIVKLLHS